MAINFPTGGVRLGGVDIMGLFKVLFDLVLQKGLVSEAELIGRLVQAGFNAAPVIPVATAPAANKPERTATIHSIISHGAECRCAACLISGEKPQ